MAKAYITIQDFKAGLDGRRLAAAADAGSLQALKNAHINRGGEIEKAKGWVSKYTLPADTFGLASVNGSLYVFGSVSTPASMPAGVSYSRLQNPDASAMTSVVAAETFSGALYVLAAYADNTRHHFYDGSIVRDWYVGLVRTSMATLDNVASALAADMVDDPVMTAVTAGAVITLTAITQNDAVTVTATAVNGGVSNDQTITVVETVAASSGVAEVDTITLGGTFDPGDKFTVNIDDNVYGATPVTGETAVCVLTHKNKMYAGAGVNLFFSCVANAALWRDNTVDSTVNTGSGSIDISSQASSSEDVTGLGVYQNKIAIFTRNATQVWAVDPDPDLSEQLQVLDNIGTRSPRSIKNFGDTDLFFLSDSGFRSLRARYAVDTASMTDVGTPIDDIVLAHMDGLTDAQITTAVAEIEPRDGRYICSLASVEYVFSYFPSSKVAAWSTYEPGFAITDFTTLNGRLYGRSGNTIYLLGGDDDDEYTTEEVLVEFPYLDARGIATWKRWTGLDVISVGTWSVYVNTNPKQPDEWVLTARITDTSIGEMRMAMQQRSPVLKFKFIHEGDADEEAKISKVIVHYETIGAG